MIGCVVRGNGVTEEFLFRGKGGVTVGDCAVIGVREEVVEFYLAGFGGDEAGERVRSGGGKGVGIEGWDGMGA